MGSDDAGEHHLKIENATIEDDAEYQCQVGPRGSAKPIRADARLTVLSKHFVNHETRPRINERARPAGRLL